MSYIFEVKDKYQRNIRLTREQWTHIREEHPHVISSEDITSTLTNPLKIITRKDNNKISDFYTYHKHRKNKSKFLKVVVNI